MSTIEESSPRVILQSRLAKILANDLDRRIIAELQSGGIRLDSNNNSTASGLGFRELSCIVREQRKQGGN